MRFDGPESSCENDCDGHLALFPVRSSPPVPIDKLIAALEADGWTVTPESTGQPYLLRLRRGSEAIRLRVYIWNVTHGGGEARPEGEFRIQKMVEGPLIIDDTHRTLLLGFYEANMVFVSWNAHVHQNAAYSASIHVPEYRLEEASGRGIAVHPRTSPPEVVIGFTGENVSFVLRALEDMPMATQDAEEANVIAEASSADGIPPEKLAGMPQQRKKVAAAATRWSRDASFRRRVLQAYARTCAFCGVQLGLVQAAHILPVPEEGSTDEASNGLCLCATCHAAFDANLLGLDEDLSVLINKEKVATLKKNGLDGGLDEIVDRLNDQADVPLQAELQPAGNFVSARLKSLTGDWIRVCDCP